MIAFSVVPLGQFTKQLAQEALESQVKDIFAAPKPAEPAPAEKAPPESVGATILKQVQAMQSALKEDEELAVLFHNGLETLRVMDFFTPSPQVIVMSGVDAAKNTTRVISPAESLQLTCKVMKTSQKPARIRFITPKVQG